MSDSYIRAELINIKAAIERLIGEVDARENMDARSEPDEPRQFKTTPPESITDPVAASMADLVTPKQLGMIRALARESRVDHDEECRRVFKVTTEELSKRAASSFIDHLKSMQGAPAQRRAS